MDNQNDFPYYFESNTCKTCGGKCCRGREGYIWISMEEIEEMADRMKIDVSLFSRQYVRQIQGRLSLQERVINGEHFCCFFDPIDGQCTIYQSRPRQCRTFPFWNQFKKEPQKLLDECPGVFLK
ncbi:MAG: YkgJ family cysteine cluster protein [Deltaproteobacteria bacterium]|nr:YkgJ family cysteine cluster protein [Deltaproteobacteria bacterium]